MERNIKSLIPYSIGATDGMIGEVEEFYFDDESWKIRYLIVKTGDWLAERKVLISPEAIVKQPWKEGFFPVSLTKEQVQNSPDIDTEKPVSRGILLKRTKNTKRIST
ncbi:PRC-barrel domain-containing protein [Mucilaginibacter sp. SP1R1]|uniref:PRC-barrel domain-containing protein n=1 Tax=Mucilaginibacter sp. SP1R1 TaxID=2723091 RepID=UPI00161DE22A|nr:PRC-barrel domain-containing protein [Mucilaginibacter sp. SP1R1]MBB6152690.1 sporulation protein YlmC with PRC-barrel domain [Mucilaginibacter sp. SP1R1]